MPSDCVFLRLRSVTFASLLSCIQISSTAVASLLGLCSLTVPSPYRRRARVTLPACHSELQSKHLSHVKWDWVVPGVMLYQNNHLQKLLQTTQVFFYFHLFIYLFPSARGNIYNPPIIFQFCQLVRSRHVLMTTIHNSNLSVYVVLDSIKCYVAKFRFRSQFLEFKEF